MVRIGGIGIGACLCGLFLLLIIFVIFNSVRSFGNRVAGRYGRYGGYRGYGGGGGGGFFPIPIPFGGGGNQGRLGVGPAAHQKRSGKEPAQPRPDSVDMLSNAWRLPNEALSKHRLTS